MTQFGQSPYSDPNQPPLPGYVVADPYGTPGGSGGLRACRAAAIAQVAFGMLVGLLAFCLAAIGVMVASGAMPMAGQEELAELNELGDMAGPFILLAGACVGLPALTQVVTGILVWRGSPAAIIVSIVVDGLLGVLMLLNIMALVVTSGMGSPGSICVNVFALVLLGGLIVLLAGAYREASAAARAKSSYEAQWQQYYHQQYLYRLAMQQAADAAMQPQPSQPAPPAQPSDVPGAEMAKPDDSTSRGNPPPLPPAV